jgi:AcrR family transcriptional regulator
LFRPNDQPLTPERILGAAEEVLRRRGPAKANVADVARALGVSHGSVYRHFPSKQAPREAVTRRWLEQFHDELEPVGELDAWLRTLHAAKEREALAEPELFAIDQVLLEDPSDVVDEHVRWLTGDLTRITGEEATAPGGLVGDHPLPSPRPRDGMDRSRDRTDLDRVLELISPGGLPRR